MAIRASSPVPPSVSIEDFVSQSPHPSSPHSSTKDVLSSPPAPPLIHLQPTLSPPHDYNFSSTVYDESSTPATDNEDAYTTTDDETARLTAGAETTSSRSSISSLPASVADPPPDKPTTPRSRPPGFGHARSGSGLRSLGGHDTALQDRDRDMTPFRHPSSVRAMQMRDEFDDDHDLTPGRRRRGSRMSAARLSTFSARSSNSTPTSPTKRGGAGGRSSQTSPQKSSSKLKKEFPLVLLHCSLLLPNLGLHIKTLESWWLKEVLPEEYWNRWKTLEEKVLGNGEVRTRGVLIPHPKSDYELLEERLLESLELQRPRVRSGHFLGAEREVEGAEEESEAESTQSLQCPDCRGKVPTGTEMERKWEIKVYAANGLMRAGAWGAAWEEMEKVDVEVGVWMPAEVRREVEARLLDMGYTGLNEDDTVQGDIEESEEERRRREIYGSPAPDLQEKIDGLFDEEYHRRQPDSEDQHIHAATATAQHSPPADLQSLVLNFLTGLAQDRRNVAIAFLSILVLFYAMASPGSKAASFEGPSPSLRQEIVTTTITTIAAPTRLSECASSTSTLSLDSVSALSGTSATDCASVTKSASSQAISANESPSTVTETSEESSPVRQQIAAVLLQDNIPATILE